jgi:hypothetical protein
MEIIKTTKKTKIEDTNRICLQLNCQDIAQKIIEKINLIETLENINSFDTVQEILNILNSLDYQKQKKINEIRQKTHDIIISMYPDYTQRNIDALRLNTEKNIKYTSLDRTTMWTRIDDVRTQGKEFQNQVNNFSNIEDLKNFTYEFRKV